LFCKERLQLVVLLITNLTDPPIPCKYFNKIILFLGLFELTLYISVEFKIYDPQKSPKFRN